MKKLFLTLVIITILIPSVTAYYRDNYWECTWPGEVSQGKYGGVDPTGSPMFDKETWECKGTYPQCCKLCVARNPGSDCMGSNAKPICRCTTGVVIPNTPPDFYLDSLDNNSVYGLLYITLTGGLTKKASFQYKYVDNIPERWHTISTGKTDINRRVRFSEGENRVVFRANDGIDVSREALYIFTIDSRAPRINRAYPYRGYGNGTFWVQYNEEQLENMTLHYKDPILGWKSITKTDCSSGRNEICTIDASNINDGVVEFYFAASDRATSVQSRVKTIIIDTVPPVFTSFSTVLENRRLMIGMQTSEKSSFSYIDQNDPNKRKIVLCRNTQKCIRPRSMRDGSYELLFSAEDAAGNSVSRSVSFVLDSRAPRLMRVQPSRGIAKKQIEITYNEVNLSKVVIIYKTNNGPNQTYDYYGCTSGARGRCSIPLGFVPDGQFDYVVRLVDGMGRTDESRRWNSVILDGDAPHIIGFDFAYENRRGSFTVNTDEDAMITYYDVSSPNRKIRLCYYGTDCNKIRYFRTGMHYELIIEATDRAGNSETAEVEFDS